MDINNGQTLLKQTKYLNFVQIGNTTKTKIIGVGNNSGVKLGMIKWVGAWRKYCFIPFQGMQFDTTCLMDIVEFIDELMNERKNKDE